MENAPSSTLSSPPSSKLSSALLKENQDASQADRLPDKEPCQAASPSLSKPRVFKIIVLGESGVGKTCLSFRFCAGRFPVMTEATIGLDFREKVLTLMNALYFL